MKFHRGRNGGCKQDFFKSKNSSRLIPALEVAVTHTRLRDNVDDFSFPYILVQEN